MSTLIKYANAFTKAFRTLPHWENHIPISPKTQGDLSGVSLPALGSSSWNPNIDLEYLQKMYDCHDMVHSCIDLVSRTFAQGHLKVKVLKDNKWHYEPRHPIQRVLDNPDSSMTGFDLRQSFIVHRLLFGTVAMICIRNPIGLTNDNVNKFWDTTGCPECDGDTSRCGHLLWSFNKGPITQIKTINLERLSKKKYPNGKEYFMYNPGGNRDLEPIHPDNIITDPEYNPGGSFYGTSPTQLVKRWLEIDLGLSEQIGAYLQNNAIPSFFVNIKPPKDGFGDDRDVSTMIADAEKFWMAKLSMRGNGRMPGKGVRGPAFGYGDMDITKIQDSLKEIVDKPLFYEIQNRIAMTYKVPKTFFEFGIDYSSQSATAKQQREDFFNDAIQPELINFRSKMIRYLVESYKDPDNPNEEIIDIEWDLSNMGVAAFLEDKKEAKITKRWEMGGITLDEYREGLGLNPYHNSEEGKQRYRVSVMSDGTFNQANGHLDPNSNLEDNRLLPDPETTSNAGMDITKRSKNSGTRKK